MDKNFFCIFLVASRWRATANCSLQPPSIFLQPSTALGLLASVAGLQIRVVASQARGIGPRGVLNAEKKTGPFLEWTAASGAIWS